MIRCLNYQQLICIIFALFSCGTVKKITSVRISTPSNFWPKEHTGWIHIHQRNSPISHNQLGNILSAHTKKQNADYYCIEHQNAELILASVWTSNRENDNRCTSRPKDKTIKKLRYLCKSRNTSACIKFAELLEEGRYTQHSKPKIFWALSQSCQQHHIESCVNIAWRFNDLPMASRYATIGCQQKSRDSCDAHLVISALHANQSLSLNSLARQTAQNHCYDGIAEACSAAIKLNIQANGSKTGLRRLSKIRTDLLRSECLLENPRACLRLGDNYVYPTQLTTGLIRAAEIWSTWCKQSSAPACFEAGKNLANYSTKRTIFYREEFEIFAACMRS